MRIGGLASGIDTDSIIADLMKAERMKIDKMKQKQQTLEWQRDQYREMNTLIIKLRDAADTIRKQGTFLAKISQSSSSNITAKASVNAGNGTYSLKVNELASSASVTTGQMSSFVAEDVSFTISGEKGSTTIAATSTDTKEVLVAKINEKTSSTGVKASYDKNLDRIFFTSSTTGSNSKVDFSENTGSSLNFIRNQLKVSGQQEEIGIKSFSSSTELMGSNGSININGQIIAYITTNTINDVMVSINGLSGTTGVSAALDATTGQLKLTAVAGSTVNLSSETPGALNDFGLIGGDRGTNANVDYNDITGLSFSSNTFSIQDITYTVSGITTDKQTITISNDTDAIFDSVLSFIDTYNEVLGEVNDKLVEERNRNYQPLTEEQKEVMSEDEIKLWEEKAKAGLLRNDSIMSSGVNDLRRSLSNMVVGLGSNVIDQMAEIGIETGSFEQKGKLILKDESKLRDAIANKPDQVLSFFTKNVDNAANETYSQSDGIGYRVYDVTNHFLDRLIEKAGIPNVDTDDSLIAKALEDIDDSLYLEENRLIRVEDRYWRQFSAMEKAINQLNSQGAWLAQQFGGAPQQ